MRFRWRSRQPASANAAGQLPKYAAEWFKAGDAALAEGRTWDEIHDFRLQTKRFRYTLEVFQPFYGPALAKKIKTLRKLQDYLGDISDCVTTGRLFEPRPELGDVRLHLESKAAAITVELRAFWQREFASPARQAQWKAYLARPLVRPPALPDPPEAAPVVQLK